MSKLVVAIGGNALLPAGGKDDATSQIRTIEETCAHLADLAEAGHELLVTHGNGPQVGNILLQNEESRHVAPSMPLDVCGAQSQAQIGYMLARALRSEFARRTIRRGVACVITQVVVDEADPAFRDPTKPIGPYYVREDEIVVKRAKGWKFIHDKRGGWRRIVPSPRPVEVVEKDVIGRLLGNGDGLVVIAGGGGGIPVIRRDGALVGVEAVIDKDLTAAVLAKTVGWKDLVIVTDVPQVALDFGKPTQRVVDRMTLAEAKKHLAGGQFPAGSMGPKIEAVIAFLEEGGRRVVITDIVHLVPAVGGKAGTQIGAK